MILGPSVTAQEILTGSGQLFGPSDAVLFRSLGSPVVSVSKKSARIFL